MPDARSPFLSDDPNMLDAWLTVGPVSRINDRCVNHPYSTRLMGATVFLWTDDSGQPCARVGDTALTVQSRYHYLWVCPSGKPARPLFELPEYTEPGRRVVDCDGFGVAVSGLRVVENFLDMAHFPFVHAHYLGVLPHSEVRDYKVAVDDKTDEIWATECRFWQPRTSAAANDGVLATYRYRVMQPFTAALYKSCVHRADALDAITLFVQPVDEEFSIAHVLLLYFEDTLSDTDLISFQHTIFAQDKPILENHLLKRMPLDGRVESPTRADLTSFVYRRWLKTRGQRFGVYPVPVSQPVSQTDKDTLR